MEISMKIMAGEIFAGLVVHNLLCAAAAWFFFRRAPVFAGLFLGMVCGGLMLLHMAFCLERAARAGESREAGCYFRFKYNSPGGESARKEGNYEK